MMYLFVKMFIHQYLRVSARRWKGGRSMFRNRKEAGQALALNLVDYKGKNAVVLAIPRGGLPVGSAIASYLDLPLDVVLVKKIGHPRRGEYAIGAVSLNDRILIDNSGISQTYIDQQTDYLRRQIKSKHQLYYQDSEPLPLKEKTVILTDDGIATGRSMLLAIQLLRKASIGEIVVAVPVAPSRTIGTIRKAADKLVCLHIASKFRAVGNFYEDFSQVTDDTAIQILQASHRKTLGF